MNYIKEIGFRKSRMRFVLSILVGTLLFFQKGRNPPLPRPPSSHPHSRGAAHPESEDSRLAGHLDTTGGQLNDFIRNQFNLLSIL